MSKQSRSAKKVAGIANDDLRERVHFSFESGQVWLHEHRMLLIHAEAMAGLRKDLVDMLGVERARRLLTRLGYVCGVHDAELIRTRSQCTNDDEAFMTGPQLHGLEGIVKSTVIKVEADRGSGKFYSENLWENSWEGHWHRRHYGTGTKPVCWSQVGYACGFTSTFMGKQILYKEVECIGMGAENCRVVGKPLEEWEDAREYAVMFSEESLAEQLIDLQTQVVQLRAAMGEKENLPSDIVGNSSSFRAAYGLLKHAAQSKITVLLMGETGVGKEVFARSLHEMGARSNAPFIAINCAAMPHDLLESELFGVEKGAYTGALASRPGRFERAHGGTLFLDEIGDLPLPAQAKLLRVLQEGEIERLGDQKVRKIDVRLVAATNIDLSQLVKEGKFRSDLYYRLNVFQINIPPLRERKEDISLLSCQFLEKFSALHGKKLKGFTEKAKRALTAYHWPGNVRELQNVIERGVILAPSGSRIEIHQMFGSHGEEQGEEFGLGSDGALGLNPSSHGEELLESLFNGNLTLYQLEAKLVQAAIDKARGNMSKAARVLGLSRRQLIAASKKGARRAAAPDPS